LIVDKQSDLPFPIAQGTLPWHNFMDKIVKIGLLSFIRRTGIPRQTGIS